VVVVVAAEVVVVAAAAAAAVDIDPADNRFSSNRCSPLTGAPFLWSSGFALVDDFGETQKRCAVSSG
jgi:hypothetical protein